MQPAEEVDPNPAKLVESLRDFGYTLQSALADLIDNSITAGARRIRVSVEADGDSSHIAVVDDGAGMSLKRLVEAMRLGTQGPRVVRSENDLGRFGLGMKTASLSQGRRLTVITKVSNDAEPVVRRWDLEHIEASGKWQLLGNATLVAARYLAEVRTLKSGTAVIVEVLDRPSFVHSKERGAPDHLAVALDAVRQHLAMVFHRFVEEGVELYLGPSKLAAWDPFMRADSKHLPSEVIPFRGRQIVVSPFVLPHHSRITEEAHEAASGPHGWNAHQGFYIYRCKRLIIPGSWLNLRLKKEEHFKLARIMVDLPNGMDADWHLNVMKSHVAAPVALRDDFKRIARDVRRQAGDIYRYRGERQAPAAGLPERNVWRREVLASGVRFRVDPTHPALRALLHGGCEHEAVLAQVIRLIETTVPVAAMLQEPAKSVDGSVDPPFTEIAALLPLFNFSVRYLIASGHSPHEAREKVLLSEPFSRCRERFIELLTTPSGPVPDGKDRT